MTTREQTISAVYHPPFIDGDWILVDEPVTRPLQQGAPTLGWEGDPRLAVYLHQPSKTFVLWRLEASNEYMPVGQFALAGDLTQAAVNHTIRRLIEVDSRRGYDPGEAVMLEVAKGDNLREEAHKARVSQMADKLMFALSQSHMPGVDVNYPRNLLRSR